MIARRTFLAGTGAVLLAAPLAAETQQAGRVYRIGILGNVPSHSTNLNFDLRERMGGTNMAHPILVTCAAGRVRAVGRTVRASLLQPQRSPEETYR